MLPKTREYVKGYDDKNKYMCFLAEDDEQVQLKMMSVGGFLGVKNITYLSLKPKRVWCIVFL